MFPHPSHEQRKHYEKLLTPGEELEFVGRIGDRYYYSMLLSGAMIFGMLLAVLPLSQKFDLLPVWLATPITLASVLGLIPVLKVLHMRHSHKYLFTNRRVIIKEGIFSLSVTTAPYDKITHIVIKQQFLNRIFYNTGTIVLHTAGPTPVEMDLLQIEDPFVVKNLLEELMHQERKSFGQPVTQPWPAVASDDVVTLD